MDMYKEIVKEVRELTGEEITPYEIAKLCQVQYGEVGSIFKQPIKLREMVLYFMYEKSGQSPSKYMARLKKSVQKALQDKLEAKLKSAKSKK